MLELLVVFYYMNWGSSMEKVFIGKIVSTHGIKGEVRILSDFPFKDRVFVVGKRLIIDDSSYEIKSYRHHKNFEMVTLGDYHDINEVLFLLKKDVYFDKDDLNLMDDEVLDDELLTFQVETVDGRVGKILEVFVAGGCNKIIRVLFDNEVLIPYTSPFVEKIDKKNKKIIVQLIDGMG